jgi:hypothetical protein
MSRIVTSSSPYRYKRPPRKKKSAAAIAMPAIITLNRKTRIAMKRAESDTVTDPEPAPLPNEGKKSATVTIRSRKPSMLAHLLEDMTPEEHKRRGDGADAMMQKFKRLIAVGKGWP